MNRRNRRGFSAIRLMFALLVISLTLFGGQLLLIKYAEGPQTVSTKIEAVVETNPLPPPIENKVPPVSVAISPSTTTEVLIPGWKIADVVVGEKKFKLFYKRGTEKRLSWKMNEIVGVAYLMEDAITHEVSKKELFGFSASMGLYGETFGVYVSRFDQNHYPGSPLQELIIKNSKEEGEVIFRKIFDGLEVIEGMKK